MKQKFEIVINASRDKVWAAFHDPANMGRWQANFSSYTHRSGDPGRSGSVAELVFTENGRPVVLTETITERRDPDFLAGTYESRHGSTLIVNHFEAIDENTTRWSSWCNFQFRGAMKFMSLFAARSIRKRTQGDMERFKLMVESDLAQGAA
jgi:uncharacterized protein YndB with AHSA1/START domain